MIFYQCDVWKHPVVLIHLFPRPSEMVVMWAIGGTLIYLAIKKDMEPSLLLPMGFGAILVNLPLSGAIDQMHELGIEVGALSLCVLPRGHLQRAVPVAAVHRHRRDDRLRPAAGQSQSCCCLARPRSSAFL